MNTSSLSPLPESDAVLLLAERSRGPGTVLIGDEATAAAELARELGYLPLALELAAAFVGQPERSTVQSYRTLFLKRTVQTPRTFRGYLEQYRKELSRTAERLPSEASPDEKIIATAVRINFNAVESESPAAADLLRLSAYVEPTVVPAELAIGAAMGVVKSLAAFIAPSGKITDEAEAHFTALLEYLTRYSLASPAAAQPYAFDVHPLIQASVRRQIAEDEAEWVQRTVDSLYRIFPAADFSNTELCARLIPHIKGLAARKEIKAHPAMPQVYLLTNVGNYLQICGRIPEAEQLFLEALAIVRQIVPEGDIKIAHSLNNLAILYRIQDRYNEAEPLLEEALAIYEAEEAAHPDPINQSYGNFNRNTLAFIYQMQGRLEESEALYASLVADWRKLPLPDKPDIAPTLHNLAGIYLAQGKPDQAEPTLREAVQLLRANPGPDDPQTQDVERDLFMLLLEKALRAKYYTMAELDSLVERDGLSPDDAIARLLGHDWKPDMG